jgi:precorrin-6Y C5,15-methyltransferase (decarboxylating)
VLGELRLIYGYELSRPEEEIRSCTPEKLCCLDESRLKEGLYVLYIEHKDAKKTPLLPGMADSSFLRGKAPMTSAEIRALSLCKLGLTGQTVVWDIGAGTGSVSVEAARTCPEGTVWSVEYKKDALELLYKNRAKFCLSNMEIIEGRAPEILKELPAPTHVFIGGSGGEIGAVIEQALAKNPRARFVADCITAETLMALQEAIRRLPVCNVQAVQVSVQRMEELGRYHYLKAQNPVFIISFSGK